MEAEVSNQSSIVSRSITSSEQILKVDEEAKDQINEDVEIKDLISYGEIYNMIEELETESSGGSYYGAKDLQKINDQIIIESNKEEDTDEMSLYYEVASERVSSKILNARALNFSITCVSPDNEVVEEFGERGSSKTQHHKTRQGQINDGKSSTLKGESGVQKKMLRASLRHGSKFRLSSSTTSLG